MKSILQSYYSAWLCLISNWKIWILLILLNLIFAIIAVSPLNNTLEMAFGDKLSLDQLISGFNYSVNMEFLREYWVGVSAFLNLSIILICLYLVFYVFINGGIIEMIIQYPQKIGFNQFWNGCSFFFSRFLRLAIYILLIYCLWDWILFMVLSKDGFNPFNFDSEVVLINRFWILVVIFFCGAFLLNTFRDFAKLQIAYDDPKYIFRSNLKAFRNGIRFPNLMLSLLNVFVLGLVILLYFNLRKTCPEFSWVAIILAQLFLMFRIAYRVVRLSSFHGIQNHS